MAANPNALQWDGGAGHYEVYYLSATDRATGCGLWIRYTMVAPAAGAREPTCSLWFMAMDPERREVLGRKSSWPASRWAWTHCNDFESLEGEPRPGSFFEGVSVFVPRLGRELGPNTPIVGRFGGEDFSSTGPLQVTRTDSRFGLTSWQVEARGGDRRVVADVDADREQLVGVTYHDPDGDLAYCYNSET